MPRDQHHKRLSSFRLTAEAHGLLAALSRKLGIPRNGILELLIREKAKSEQVEYHLEVSHENRDSPTR